jgi:predicted transcriptional regulator
MLCYANSIYIHTKLLNYHLRCVLCEVCIHKIRYPCYIEVMHDLQAAGLSQTEAVVYRTLLSQREWRPSLLAKNVAESRTNIYKILDKLVSLGLAERFDKNKVLHYRACSPARLYELAHQLREERQHSQKEMELAAQDLMSTYTKVHDQPGIRFFQGKLEIREIFQAIAKSKTPVRFLHTIAGIDFYGYEHMHFLRMLAVNAGIERFALTPDTPLATQNYATTDKRFYLQRTWLQQEDYTAPVEWGVFDNKLYIISYGQEALGMVIESEQIADAFRQILALLERGQRLLPDYNLLPKLAKRPAKTA